VTTSGSAVVLVYSTGHALKAEKAIKAQGISCKLIPVPRHLSSDCGVCVCIPAAARTSVEAALKAALVEFDAIHDI